MEKLSQKQEENLKSIFHEVGLEKPSKDFVSNIMNVIETSENTVKVSKPLISKKGWVLIISVFVISCGALLFYPGQGSDFFNTVFTYRADFTKKAFQGFEISKTLVMGIALLGLFLFQLPFLIKMTSKERAI